MAVCGNERPLIYGVNEENWQDLLEIAKKHNCPAVVSEKSTLDKLSGLIENIKSKNFDNIIIEVGCNSFSEYLQKATIMRRFAVNENSDSFGYPIITDLTNRPNPYNIMSASLSILKY